MPLVHELKIDKPGFRQIMTRNKTCEVRRCDRAFTIGDYLMLQETRYTGAEMDVSTNAMPLPLEYTGHGIMAKITHMHTGQGVAPGWCVLSIQILDLYPSLIRNKD